MKKLTKAQVLRMYNDMVNQFGGTEYSAVGVPPVR